MWSAMVWWCAASGAVLFVMVFSIHGALRPGYSATRHTVSALANGKHGWIQGANFIAGGLAVTAGAVGLVITGTSVLLGAVLSVFGLALVASGVFPMDPMRGYPPGTPHTDPESFTRSHVWHDYAGAAVFFSLPLAAAVATFVLPGTAWTVASAVMLVALITALSAFNWAWEKDSSHTGVIQRVFLVPGLAWLAAVFTHFALASASTPVSA